MEVKMEYLMLALLIAAIILMIIILLWQIKSEKNENSAQNSLEIERLGSRLDDLRRDFQSGSKLQREELNAAIESNRRATTDAVGRELSDVRIVLNEKLDAIRGVVDEKMTKALDERIAYIFISVGIPAHIKGYQFLREAIKMAIFEPDIINSITKRLYPTIAERFQTTPSKVERAIRHAIEVSWNRGKIENINNIFGIKVYSANEKPTNGEFIALVADKMLLEGVC